MLTEHNSGQISIFRNSHFGKCLFKTYFQLHKSLIILENINLSRNCHESFLLCSPSITQHNFTFFEIHILENVGPSANNSNFKTVWLFWKILIWVENGISLVLAGINSAQISLFRNFFTFFGVTCFLETACVLEFAPAAQYWAHSILPTTSFLFLRKQNGGAIGHNMGFWFTARSCMLLRLLTATPVSLKIWKCGAG